MQKHCPAGHENDESAAFCGTCGARLDGEFTPTKQRPNWLLPAVIAGLVVVAGALVAIVVIMISTANAKAEQEAAEEARLARITVAVESCDVSPVYVIDGGRKFEVTTGIGSDVAGSDVKCILTALQAPQEVLNLGASVHAGDPPRTVGWEDFTYTIHYPKLFADSTKTIEMHD